MAASSSSTATTLTFLVNDMRERVSLEAGASRPVMAFFEELCARRGLDARRFAVVTKTAAAGAKRAVRVDLSLPVRLAGLAPGALLELQLLPQDEGGGGGGGGGSTAAAAPAAAGGGGGGNGGGSGGRGRGRPRSS
jgi:hypothetical protein